MADYELSYPRQSRGFTGFNYIAHSLSDTEAIYLNNTRDFSRASTASSLR